VHHSGGEYFHITLTPSSPLAVLPQLAFDGATKKTRPNLQSGDLVYARVRGPATKYLDAIELECLTISPDNGVSDAGLGPLKAGSVCDVSLEFARRLMMGPKKGGVGVLQAIGERFRFEVAVGRNGRVWIASDEVLVVLKVIQALKETDQKDLDEAGQKILVGRVIKELGAS
jgi:exosome complex component RRP40